MAVADQHATSDPVLQWAPQAQAASARYGIPAAVLLGLVHVESGGIEGRTSSTGAGGLTQFMPGTAKGYGVDVRPGHALSQLMGAARYLHDLGFARDPEGALAAYNGGPFNKDLPVTRAYARTVLDAAKRYGGSTIASSPTTSSGGGGNLFSGLVGSVGKALLYVALILGGVALIGIGVHRTVGGRA
jgi:soluble lytic murein transglycosylase-like protein